VKVFEGGGTYFVGKRRREREMKRKKEKEQS